MSDKKGSTILSSLTLENAVLLLSMAVKANGGSMTFPREVFEALGDVEHIITRDANDDVVITLEPYYEQ
jgi:hypothetical protein